MLLEYSSYVFLHKFKKVQLIISFSHHFSHELSVEGRLLYSAALQFLCEGPSQLRLYRGCVDTVVFEAAIPASI